MPRGLFRRAIGSQPSVRIGSDFFGLQELGKLNDVARRGLHRLRVAAVAVKARETAVHTVHVVAAATGDASAAADLRMDHDRIPLL
jgi:hypothetical protein